jgi:hypothetical protein
MEVYSNGGRYVQFNEDIEFKFGLTDPKAMRALQFANELYNIMKAVTKNSTT